MKAKEYLNQIRIIDRLIEHKQIEILKLRSKLAPKGITYESDKVKTSIVGNPTAEIICTIVDYENEIKADTERLINLKKEITSIVDSLNDADMIDVLYQRYYQYKNWVDIATNMNMSLKNIYRLHGKALSNFEKKLPLN